MAALYMAVSLVWDASRDPLLGIDVTLYGASDRPAALLGADWRVDQMRSWAPTYDIDVLASGSAHHPGLMVGFPAHPGSEFDRWVREGYPCLRNCLGTSRSLATDPGALHGFEVGVLCALVAAVVMGAQSRPAADVERADRGRTLRARGHRRGSGVVEAAGGSGAAPRRPLPVDGGRRQSVSAT